MKALLLIALASCSWAADYATEFKQAEDKHAAAIAVADADMGKSIEGIIKRLDLVELPVPSLSADPTASEAARVQEIKLVNSRVRAVVNTVKERGAKDASSISVVRDFLTFPTQIRNAQGNTVAGPTPYSIYLREKAALAKR